MNAQNHLVINPKCDELIPTKCVANEWKVWNGSEYLSDRNLLISCSKFFFRPISISIEILS